MKFLRLLLSILTLVPVLTGTTGCRTPNKPSDARLLDEEGQPNAGATGPCDERAVGAAIAVHRQHYDLESVNHDSLKFLGLQSVGSSDYATYFVLNTDETDGGGWLLAFPMGENGRCGWIPYIDENEPDSDQRLYQLLPY